MDMDEFAAGPNQRSGPSTGGTRNMPSSTPAAFASRAWRGVDGRVSSGRSGAVMGSTLAVGGRLACVHRLETLDMVENIRKLRGVALFLVWREFQPGELGDMAHLVKSKGHGEANYSRPTLAAHVERREEERGYNEPVPCSYQCARRSRGAGLNAIEVENLRRVYKATVGVIRRKIKEVVAVEDISFDVKSGELFGLLGPNGAGKTTMVKMLTTLLLPTSGTARVLGHDVVSTPGPVRSRIGFIFGGERGLYWRLSGFDNLRYFASLYHVDPDVSRQRIPYLMEMVGLRDRGNEKVEGYSRGMKQRLHIARTLLHDPEVLFLDEPTIGLDPVGARELRQVVRDLQSESKTILLTTHYMFEADLLCDRIAVINHGRIVAMDTPTGLKRNVSDLSVIEIEVFGIPEDVVEDHPP